ncbi:MAG: hypothetical protein AAB377_01025 [Patescibacteria group bacterium]
MDKKKKIFKSITSSYLELDELITRVLCDSATSGRVEAAYLFGETKDNQSSVLKAAGFLYSLGPVKKLGLCGMPEGFGYPGFKNWRNELVEMGVKKEDIYSVPPSDKFPPSTDAEAWGLVDYAKNNGWKSVFIIAPPLHQLRAFVSVVSAVVKSKSNLLVYSFPGIPQSWEEHITHSQGILKGTRSELLANELAKIEKYYKNGDLISAAEVLKYMDERDKRVARY